MKIPARFPVLQVTSLLLLGCLSIFSRITLLLAELLFIFSPLLMFWIVFSVLKANGQPVPELKEDQEWGYSDREN